MVIIVNTLKWGIILKLDEQDIKKTALKTGQPSTTSQEEAF